MGNYYAALLFSAVGWSAYPRPASVSFLKATIESVLIFGFIYTFRRETDGRREKIAGKKNILFCIASILIFCVLLFPIYWIVVTSLKMKTDIFQTLPTLWPEIFMQKYIISGITSGAVKG